MERLTTLPEIEAEVWRQLAQAVGDKGHAWRTPVLATVNGDTAEARTVILREVDAKGRRLLTYTDERAGKARQILHNPRGTLAMWSPALGWQLRCRVFLDVEMSGLSVASRWARINLSPAAQDYLSLQPPGAPLVAQDAAPPNTTQRTHFAVIVARVVALDWLELHPLGHRRAVFDDEGSRWVQP